MRSTRFLFTSGSVNWFHAGLLVLFIAGSVMVAPHLPERIPIHYGFDGRVDATTPSSGGAWYLLPGIAVAMALFLRGLAAVAAEADTWKLTDEELRQFRTLPDAEQAELVESVRCNLAQISIAISVVFVAIQTGNYMVATTGESSLPVAVWGVMITAIASVFFLAFSHDRELKRRIHSSPAANL
ncbi:MAG: DUF1648 domain-containing protein [Gemmatimonadaceae bacterium]